MGEYAQLKDKVLGIGILAVRLNRYFNKKNDNGAD
jgi:hypothetical protein